MTDSKYSSSDAIPRRGKSSITWGTRYDITGPTFTNLTLGNLKRTASTFMSEWERSITTPPVDEASDGFVFSRGSTPMKERKFEWGLFIFLYDFLGCLITFSYSLYIPNKRRLQ